LDEPGVLTFLVLERPALREWRAAGADRLEQEDVQAAVKLKPREILDQALVDEGARAIRDLYAEKGYYLAEVQTEIVPVPDGKNQVDVVYTATEGKKVRIKDVHLMGVEQVDEHDLRKHLLTKPAGYWSWLTSSGTFKESDLARDLEMIRAYYLNHGHAEVEVKDPSVSLTSDRSWLRIDIPVREGESFRVGEVTFANDLEFPVEDLRATAGLKEGDTFRSDDLVKGRQQLSDLYGDAGYAFAEVNPKTRLDREARTLSVEFEIHKGDPVHIGRIEVRGNTKTRDRIVRREMRLSEGELYSGTAIRKSRRRLEALGFFEKVNLTTHRRPGKSLVDIDVEVEEKPTGSFSIGAGYSSVDKIIGMASVNQRNLLGLGYQLDFSVNFGGSRQTYSATFNNPRVFDTEVFVGFDVYNAIRQFTDYDKDATGGDVKVGWPIAPGWRTRWTYRYEDAEVKDVDENASQYLKDQEGKTITSSITALVSHDSRDNPWDVHRGAKAELSVEWAGGLLGGEAAFLKYGLDASKYVPLWWSHVLTFHGRIGFVQALEGKTIPVYERYFLGGITTIRGFDSRSIGPTEDGDVIGGDKELLFNVEYVFPIVKETKMSGVLFFDAGNAWEEGDPYFASGLRRSVGFGMRWVSPMGPLRLEWGYVLDRKSDEQSSQWEFSVGGFF
jgi:outer membrane protein insertion porin family